MEQKEYTCYTDCGHWTFWAWPDPTEILRVALYLCWRDGERFIKVESRSAPRQTLRICAINADNSVTTL